MLSALVAVFLLSLPFPGTVAAQGATPTPTGPGFVASVERTYEKSGTQTAGTGNLGFLVGRFDSDEHASDRIVAILPTLAEDLGLAPTSAPKLGDESVAYTGESEEDERYEAALLIVRVGRDVHVWLAGGFLGSPLDDLLTIAEEVFAKQAASSRLVSDDELASLLPDLDDLPPGFVLDEGESVRSAATPTP